MHCMRNMTTENHRIMATLEALVITALLTLGSIGVSGNTGELSTTTGDTVLIPCDFGEGTVRNLYWYYNDGTGPVKILTLFRGNYYVKLFIDVAYDNRASLRDDSSTLILTDITVNDEGTYRCDVEREGQTAVPNINTKLNVFSLTPDTLPEIAECTDADCIIYSNKSITITCALRNVYPVEDVKLIWYQDGQLVTSPNDLTLNDDGTIDLIRPIQVAESGNFTCNASFLTTQGVENAAVSVGVWITTEPENTPGKKLTSGQTAGIVVCALAVPLLVIALLIVRKRRKKSKDTALEQTGQRKKNKDSNIAETVSLITFDNRTDVVEEHKLTLLARNFPVGKLHEFCLLLDRKYNDADVVLNKHSKDCEKAILESLMEWRTRTGGHRSVLQEALKQAGIGGLLTLIAETTNDAGPSDRQSSPIQGQDKTTYSSSLPTVPNPKRESKKNRSGRREVTSKEIIRLAGILPASKFDELFNALGFDYNYRTKILKKHHMDISAATADLLEQWKAEVHGYMDVLDEALKEAGLPKYKQVLEHVEGSTRASAPSSSPAPTNTVTATAAATTTTTTAPAASHSSLPKASASKQEGIRHRSGKREITSGEITELANLSSEGKYSKLFNALGFDYNYHQKILKKHHKDYTAAAEELLEEWKAKTHGYIEVLDEALKIAELGGLIPKYKKVLEGSN